MSTEQNNKMPRAYPTYVVGPRQVAREIDSLADDIGNPMAEMLKALPLTYLERIEAVKKMDEILTDVFCGAKVWSIKNHIHRESLSMREMQDILQARKEKE